MALIGMMPSLCQFYFKFALLLQTHKLPSESWRNNLRNLFILTLIECMFSMPRVWEHLEIISDLLDYYFQVSSLRVLHPP